MAAQLTIFSARPADALVLAERVLAGSPPRQCAIRASSARTMALALVDRTGDAFAAANALVAELAAGPVSPYTQGIAHVAALLTRFVYWADQDTPTTEPTARWPVPPASGDLTARSEADFFPLFDGGRRLLEGRVDQAIVPLREAVAQQRSGEGLLRSEAVALLIVALSSIGQPAEARRLLEEAPPDDVAIYPGLWPWAASSVEAATGAPPRWRWHSRRSTQARAVGCPISAVAYLSAAARYGAAERAAAALDSWGHRPDAPLSAARVLGVRAMAHGGRRALLEAAERHAAIGVLGEALRLAELAVVAGGDERAGVPAEELAAEMRRRLRGDGSAGGNVVALTGREEEVAALAAKGLSDREIADALVVSIRTVESHLAAAYRKLGVTSRRDLLGSFDRRSGRIPRLTRIPPRCGSTGHSWRGRPTGYRSGTCPPGTMLPVVGRGVMVAAAVLAASSLFDTPRALAAECATTPTAAGLDAFFAADDAAGLAGADYPHAYALPDGRTLWLFQDAFFGADDQLWTDRFAHNAALVQSGSCFELLPKSGGNGTSWIGSWVEDELEHWFWPLDAEVGADGHLWLFLAEVRNPSGGGAARGAKPVATWRARYRLPDLRLVDLEPAGDPSSALFGYSIVSDDEWSYLYGHCYRQYVPDAVAGFDPACSPHAYLARVPKGQLGLRPQYWSGSGWTSDRSTRQPVLTGLNSMPVSVERFGDVYVAVSDEDDWFGSDVVIRTAAAPWGPWSEALRYTPDTRCGERCNNYGAFVLPRLEDDQVVIAQSNNAWDMPGDAYSDASMYRISVRAVTVPGVPGISTPEQPPVPVPDDAPAAGTPAAFAGVREPRPAARVGASLTLDAAPRWSDALLRSLRVVGLAVATGVAAAATMGFATSARRSSPVRRRRTLERLRIEGARSRPPPPRRPTDCWRAVRRSTPDAGGRTRPPPRRARTSPDARVSRHVPSVSAKGASLTGSTSASMCATRPSWMLRVISVTTLSAAQHDDAAVVPGGQREQRRGGVRPDVVQHVRGDRTASRHRPGADHPTDIGFADDVGVEDLQQAVDVAARASGDEPFGHPPLLGGLHS